MKEELISIIVPIYNVAKYLDRCMKSLLDQSYQNIEIILIDDGSTDDSGEKCEFYSSKDNRINVIHKKNEGLGMARNSGLKIAQGKYVLFVDSDDYIESQMIERLYDKLKKNNADTCFCRYYNTSVDGRDTIARELYKKNNYLGEEVKEVLLGMIGSQQSQPGDVEIGMSVWKGLYSLDIIRNNHIIFPSEREYISEDIIFHIHYIPLTKHIAIENTANYHYCDNGSSLTKKYNPNRFIMEKRLMKKEISELEKIFEKDEFIQRLYKAFLGRVRYCIKQEVLLNSKKIKIRKNIKAICSDETVQDIILNFDDKKIQITKRIVNFFIKKKLVFALMIVFRIKK